MAPQRNRTDALAIGRETERLVKEWLKARGERVLPTGEDNKAPLIEAEIRRGSLRVPDLLALRAGASRWWEVKWKARDSDLTRVTGRHETGIDWDAYKDYQCVEEVSGIPVWIIFLHPPQNEALAMALAEVLPRFVSPEAYKVPCKGGMAFFPCDRMARIASYEDIVHGRGTTLPALVQPTPATPSPQPARPAPPQLVFDLTAPATRDLRDGSVLGRGRRKHT